MKKLPNPPQEDLIVTLPISIRVIAEDGCFPFKLVRETKVKLPENCKLILPEGTKLQGPDGLLTLPIPKIVELFPRAKPTKVPEKNESLERLHTLCLGVRIMTANVRNYIIRGRESHVHQDLDDIERMFDEVVQLASTNIK